MRDTIAGMIAASALRVLSMLGGWVYAGSTVNVGSFVDAVTIPKHIGVFRKRRKVSTLFRRT